jgi:hypothetical protein
MFVANLFHEFPAIPNLSNSTSHSTQSSKSAAGTAQELAELLETDSTEKREERGSITICENNTKVFILVAIRVWINSLNIGYPVKHLSEELQVRCLLMKLS